MLNAVSKYFRMRFLAFRFAMFLSHLCLTVRILVGAAMGLSLITQAHAQSETPGLGSMPSRSLTQPPDPTIPPVAPREHFFGDWGGIRPPLEHHGIDLIAGYLSETMGNVTGGRGRGIAYADNRGIELKIDWNKLAGWNGLTTRAIVINRAGRSLSSTVMGDSLYPVQEIAGGGGNVAAHLSMVYAEQLLLKKRVSIAVGRLQVATDFASSPLYCEFVSNAFCGVPTPLSAGDRPAFTNGAAANWGGRIRGRPTPEIYVESGVFESNSARGGRTGLQFSPATANGMMIPVEIGWEPGGGNNERSGHYKIGAYYDSARTNTLYRDLPSDEGYDLPAPSNNPATQKTIRGRSGFWIMADQMLLRRGPYAREGLIVFAGFTLSDDRFSPYRSLGFVGMVDRAFWPARRRDSYGFAVYYAQQSRGLKALQKAEQAAGQPLTGGVPGPQGDEIIMEAEYTIHACEGLTIEPDLQVVVHPGGVRQYGTALVLGFRTNVSF
ncbi:Porin [Granulibacter bethesdensis]|uniref:Porin n=2 Tax=Granulibacter bethesdensis TaxID=364410 RepID=A0AAN0RCY8_9PROT|nr:Porin [Granulibacter bethesdensis]